MKILLEDRRRRAANWVLRFQHFFAGVPLLYFGLNNLLTDEGERPLAALEVAIATCVVVTFFRELLAERRQSADSAAGPHSGVGWFDLAAGVLLMFEAFHGAHVKPGYLRPPFFAGLVTLGIGVLHGRMKRLHQRHNYVTLDETGLVFRYGPFRRLSLPWADLASIHFSGAIAVFRRTDGRRHSIRLSWFSNADDVRRAVTEHPAAAPLLEEPGPRLL